MGQEASVKGAYNQKLYINIGLPLLRDRDHISYP